MTDTLHHPRIRGLLNQALDAHHLKQKLARDGDPTHEVDAALEVLFRDLGRTLFQLAVTGGGAPAGAPGETPAPTTPEVETEDGGGSWYTEEVVPAGRLFDVGELDDLTELPESAPRPPEESGGADP